jgi:hypothetical protein
MSPNNWGPPTWVFLHTICEKIKDESFPIIGNSLVSFIMNICSNLPCPECSQHSKLFWSKVNKSNIKNKIDLINILFVFHNVVNKRKRYAAFKYQDLKYYKSRNVIETYNSFTRNFNTKGNMKLLTESFHRNIMMASLKKWLMSNLIHFHI